MAIRDKKAVGMNGIRDFTAGFIFIFIQNYFSGPFRGRAIAPVTLPMDPPLRRSTRRYVDITDDKITGGAGERYYTSG